MIRSIQKRFHTLFIEIQSCSFIETLSQLVFPMIIMKSSTIPDSVSYNDLNKMDM